MTKRCFKFKTIIIRKKKNINTNNLMKSSINNKFAQKIER